MTITNHIRRIAIAPMLEWTDRHCRYFFRLFSQNVLLYTEMITTGALLHSNPDRLLTYDNFEHPIALQLGGSNPKDLASCAKLAVQYGYDEINLNVGCPSNRVQSGQFGACLMAKPELVRDCVAAMHAEVKIPITVKTRIGIDNQDSYDELVNFISEVAAAGCNVFIIHARKAWLNGLSPKENREIPPLRYDVVYRIKQDFPHLHIMLNGGITNLEQAKNHLAHVDGVMIGRAAYQHPYILAAIDQTFYGNTQNAITRQEVIEKFIAYVKQQSAQGTALKHMARHIFGLFNGLPSAKTWRRYLSEHIHSTGVDEEVIRTAANFVLNPTLEGLEI